MADIKIDIDRLSSELAELAKFSSEPPPVVTRVVFSDADMRARAYVKSLCAEAGLTVREDAVGNTFARWGASGAPAVGTGSHIDAIPNAGMYDGTVGVMGGLEAIRALQRSGFEPKAPIELLLFTAEEPTRFGIGCLGSRLLAGELKDQGEKLWDLEGINLNRARRMAGFGGQLSEVPLPKGYYKAFIELHIEQGLLLENEKIPIGVVTAIAAPASSWITVKGSGGHAGGVLMQDRHDALVGASQLILLAEGLAKGSHSKDTVATVGICNVFPGAINSIPSEVKISLDVRDIELKRRDRILEMMEKACRQLSSRTGMVVDFTKINADAPARCDPTVVQTIQSVCDEANIPARSMVSRAYHDSLFVSRFAPVGMIFIPCRGGVSHRPDEYASPDDIELGVRVLASSLAKLSVQ